MKRLFVLGLALALPALMIACGRGGNDNNTTASTPLAFNNPVYQQYGFYPYPNTYQNPYQQAYNPYSSYYGYQNQQCGCSQLGANFLPVFFAGGGSLGCVRPEVYAPVQSILGLFSLNGAANTQWVNIPQVSNIASSCGQAAQACTPNTSTNGGCQAGYRCATATGAPIGLCISNNGYY